jgi:RNA polymerase sigma-70 factor, ECF subfamily
VGWPPGWVDEARFAAWIAERSEGADATTLPARRDELYLACACASGNEDAIRAFEERHFVEVDRAVARMRQADLSADELRQRLRVKLYVGEGARPPAFASYAGRGDLGAWFRAIVARLILDHVGARRELPTEDALFDALTEEVEGVETAHLRQVYRAELRAAFAEATERLGTVEKNLLRYAFVDGLGVDALAAIYKVHRATAARRLEAARESLGTHLREVLTERLQVSETELGSIVRLVLSSVDLTIARYLGRPS